MFWCSNLVLICLVYQGDKVRRRNDWMRWLMPAVQFPVVPGPQTPVSQGTALAEPSTNNSSGGQSNYQPQLPNGDGSALGGADRSFSGRN